MKQVFLDGGTHYGQGLQQFIQMYNITPEWTIHTFEANPVTYTHFLNRNSYLSQHFNINHYNKALSDRNGIVTIYQETPPNEDNSGMGSSIVPLDKWNPWNGTLRETFKTTSEVECISLSEFISSNFSKEDFIVVKLDIEGSEYDVLESLIETGAIFYINDLYVEFHSRFFTNLEEIVVRENNIKSFISNNTQVRLTEWH
jgi:FkbM family methyltransferase